MKARGKDKAKYIVHLWYVKIQFDLSQLYTELHHKKVIILCALRKHGERGIKQRRKEEGGKTGKNGKRERNIKKKKKRKYCLVQPPLRVQVCPSASVNSYRALLGMPSTWMGDPDCP